MTEPEDASAGYSRHDAEGPPMQSDAWSRPGCNTVRSRALPSPEPVTCGW